MVITTFKWFFVFLTLIGYFLNAKKIKWCFLIWVVCSIGWIIINLITFPIDWPLIGNFTVYLCFEIYGYFQWSKDEKEIKERKNGRTKFTY
jgi:nicotinamide riboside transporter PnuC